MPTFGPLRALLICPDAQLRAQLEEALAALEGQAQACHTVAAYPNGTELARALRTFTPQFVLLSFEKAETAVAVMRFLEAEANGLPVIAVAQPSDPLETQAMMREGMRAGAREFLIPPFAVNQLAEALSLIRGALKLAPLAYTATDHIYSFLPSKPGVGATTVALNTSAAFARLPGMKVLLADLDLACGMIRFLWKLPQDLSITDAMTRASELDAALWPQLVSQRDGVDVLHSGTINPQAHLEAPQVQSLIDFARANYNALFFDMSGNFERHSIQVMQESKRVFLVCNPEPGSLYQAQERLQFLRTLGLEGRVSAIVNRADQDLAVPTAKVEALLGVPIAVQFSDNHAEVQRATSSARSLFPGLKKQGLLGGAGESLLAGQYAAFARSLLESGRSDAAQPTAVEAPGRVLVPV